LSVFYSRHLTEVWAEGVTSVITSPLAPSLLSGTGVAFNTISNTDLANGKVVDDVLIQSITSLHMHIGNNAKIVGQAAASISGQISTLRALFSDFNTSSVPVQMALSRQIPVVAHVDQVDEIASAVRLKKEFGFDLVILGGAEAWLVAPLLARENVSVVLMYLTPPSTFETWRSSESAPNILYQNNVKFAISITDAGLTRSLRFLAGYAAGNGIPWIEALKSITLYPAQIFGIDSTGTGSITEGTPANFVALNSLDALSYDSYVDLVALKEQVSCDPQHY